MTRDVALGIIAVIVGLELSLISCNLPRSPGEANRADLSTPRGQDDSVAPGSDSEGSSKTVNQRQVFEEQFRELLATMGVTILPDEGTIEVAGWVNMQEGLIEVFACAPGGKVHESVIVLDCLPSGVHAGLLALGVDAGSPVEYGAEDSYRAPQGEGIIIEVRYQTAQGKTEQVRAEDWIWNPTEERSMEHVAWLFTGSFMQPNPPQKETYAADYVKSIVTTYHDPSTIIENPLLTGQDDTLFYANKNRVAPVGTPVTVLFRPDKAKGK